MNIKKSIAKFLLLATFITINPMLYASTKTTNVKDKEQSKTVTAKKEKTKINLYTKNKIPKKIEKKIEKIVNESSNLAGFASFKRKSKQERIKDNIAWYKKHGEVNEFYNRYGLDIKNYRSQDGYFTGKELDRMAIHHGNVDPTKYKELLRDKMLFDEIVRQSYPETVVDVYFEFKGKDIIPKENTMLKDYKDTLSALESLNDGKYFIKELAGICGNNAILLTKQNGDMEFQHVTDGTITLEDFWKITSEKEFLVQKNVENHNDLKRLSPAALSTIRMVTTRFNEDVHIFSSDLRVSCSKDSIVDNFSKDGAIINIDENTGKLAKYAFRKRQRILDKHPVSGIKFENYQLPFWKESVELVKKLHKLFPEFSSIGWDIAITENGPVVIEGNSNWEYTIPQTTVGGLAEKWAKAHNI